MLVDVNGLQGFGTTREVASMDELGARRMRGFRCRGRTTSTATIIRAIAEAVRDHPGAVILLHTVKGKGVSFMENRMEWHYLPLSAAQYAAALARARPAMSRGRS